MHRRCCLSWPVARCLRPSSEVPDSVWGRGHGKSFRPPSPPFAPPPLRFSGGAAAARPGPRAALLPSFAAPRSSLPGEDGGERGAQATRRPRNAAHGHKAGAGAPRRTGPAPPGNGGAPRRGAGGLGGLGNGRVTLPHTGTYTGDPPPGLSVRGAFFGRKSDKEVCGGVVSVVSEPSTRRRSS
jgi:hypothetical protein